MNTLFQHREITCRQRRRFANTRVFEVPRVGRSGAALHPEKLDRADALCEGGHLELDNNRTGWAILGVAVSATTGSSSAAIGAARPAAVLRSCVASCQRVGVDPSPGSRVLSRVSPITPSLDSPNCCRSTPRRPTSDMLSLVDIIVGASSQCRSRDTYVISLHFQNIPEGRQTTC